MARRGRGAVTQALDAGSAAENVDAGITELMNMAEEAGPASVPDNLGNFNPEGSEPPARPERRGTPQRLPGFDEENALRQVQQAQPGDEEVAEPPQYQPPQQPAAEPAQGDVEPVEFASADDELSYLRDLRARYESNEQTRQDRLEAAIAALAERQAGAAPAAPGYQPTTAGAPAGGPATIAQDPRAQQLAEGLKYENILPYKIDATVLEALGLPVTAQAQATLDTILRTAIFNVATKLIQTYTLDQQYTRQSTVQQAQAQHQQAQLQQQTVDAFWAANADLLDFADEVEMVSVALKARNPGIQPADWIRETSLRTRAHLRNRGVNVSLYPAVTPRNRPPARTAGAIGGGQPVVRPRIRPAGMDFGGRSGGSMGRTITPQEKEMLDLANFNGATH